jgi:hypothetical protein
MKVADLRRAKKIRLSVGARRTNLTSQGLLKILRRTGSAIRDDGRWYVDASVIDKIAAFAECVFPAQGNVLARRRAKRIPMPRQPFQP